MFDNGQSTFGVYGYKDQHAYIMDPHDFKEKYYESKSQDELDMPIRAKLNPDHLKDMGSLREDYEPCFMVHVDDLDVKNYCIL